tara:strand:- start:580 stop:744 length:165 start_codon:yes stop_codon:yes gene_type:complete
MCMGNKAQMVIRKDLAKSKRICCKLIKEEIHKSIGPPILGDAMGGTCSFSFQVF